MFDSDSYEVKQKLVSIGKKYTVLEEGEEILKCEKKKLKLKEDFRFETLEGVPVFRVTTDEVIDLAATYNVVDEHSDEPVGAVKQDFTLLRHRWQILDAGGENIATVNEDSMPMALARRFITSLIPFSYSISKGEGVLAEINGQFSVSDRYSIEIKGDIDPRLVIAATVVIDAMEAN